MLTRVDRMQVVVANGRAAAVAVGRLLGAQVVREDRVRMLAAHRTSLRVGRSDIARAEALRAARTREDGTQRRRLGSPENLAAIRAFQTIRRPTGAPGR